MCKIDGLGLRRRKSMAIIIRREERVWLSVVVQMVLLTPVVTLLWKAIVISLYLATFTVAVSDERRSKFFAPFDGVDDAFLRRSLRHPLPLHSLRCNGATGADPRAVSAVLHFRRLSHRP